MAAFTSSKTFLHTSAQRPVRSLRARTVAVRAQADEVSRRATLAGMAGAAAVVLNGEPAMAAYGEGANVFGSVTNKTGFVSYAGDGFAFLLPSKWNPSRERDTPDVVLRYADNGDDVNNVIVVKAKTDKNKIEDYGTPEKFVESISDYLGQQSWVGDTISEGGFSRGKSSGASLLEVGSRTDKKGKTYYTAYVLTRSSDGNEGGRHHVIVGTVSNGTLYLLKAQAGDKRWFKGARGEVQGCADSFQVA